MKEKTSSDTTTKHFLTLTDVKSYRENDSFNPKNHLNLIEMHFSVKKKSILPKNINFKS